MILKSIIVLYVIDHLIIFKIDGNIQKYVIKNNNIIEKDKDLEFKKIELELKKKEENILKLQLKLQNSKKHDNVTLNKLNKLLMQRNNLIKNSTVNSHNTVNNNQIINNNFQIYGL